MAETKTASASTSNRAAMEEERERRRLAVQPGEEMPPVSEVHTYKDGSQVVGVPPFPDKSPLERDAEQKRTHAAAHGGAGPGAVGMAIPHGMKTSGEAAPTPVPTVTAEGFKKAVEQQLTSDVTSGKDPHTPNPTTSSDKPQLAGTAGIPGAGTNPKQVLSADPSAEELQKIAGQIKPTGEAVKGATKEEIEAAATQVAREIKGPVVADDKSSQK